jgi:hypothetical protein
MQSAGPHLEPLLALQSVCNQYAISMQSAGPHLEPLLALQPSKARVRGCIQRRIGQLAVRDEQDVGAAVHHLMRVAISMQSGMPLGCH